MMQRFIREDVPTAPFNMLVKDPPQHPELLAQVGAWCSPQREGPGAEVSPTVTTNLGEPIRD